MFYTLQDSCDNTCGLRERCVRLNFYQKFYLRVLLIYVYGLPVLSPCTVVHTNEFALFYTRSRNLNTQRCENLKSYENSVCVPKYNKISHSGKREVVYAVRSGVYKCYLWNNHERILFTRLQCMSKILLSRKAKEVFKEINCISGK
jgi:hypothetical protein